MVDDQPKAAPTFCCDSFKAEAECAAGAGFELQKDGTWSVNGCCGGGCYVVNEMKFCPYCGTKL